MPKTNPTPGSQIKRRDWRPPIRLGLSILLGIDLVLAVLVFWPAGPSFADQKQELETLRADVQAKRESVSHWRKIESNLPAVRKQGDDFYQHQFLPDATGYSTIMEEVDKLAVDSGVKKGQVGYQVAEVKGRPDLESVDISTTLEGDYAKIVHFVNKLEQSNLFLIVDSLSVASSTQTRTVKLSVRLITYFRTA